MRKTQTFPGAFFTVSLGIAAVLLGGAAFMVSTGDVIADEQASRSVTLSESGHAGNSSSSFRLGMAKEEVRAMVAKIKGMTLRDLPSGIVFNYGPASAEIQKWDPATAKFTFNEGGFTIQGRSMSMVVPYDKILYIIMAPGNRLVFWLG